MNAVIKRCVKLLMQYLSKTTFASIEKFNGLHELFLSEVRPKRVRHIELAVCGLPKQVVRKAEFSTGTDNQVRIGSALLIEILCK